MDRCPASSPFPSVAAVLGTSLLALALVVPVEGAMVTRLAVVVLLAILVVPFHASAAGTASSPNGWGWWAPTTDVAVVGDSLVYQAEHGGLTSDPAYQYHQLTDELAAAGARSDVAAKSGATTGSLRMWGGWESKPDVIVMALGTNDDYFNLPLSWSQANVRAYLNIWPQACPVLVGVRPSAPRGINPTGWNNWLKAEAAARGGVFVDWVAISAPHPEWFVPWGGGLDVHQTAAGQAAYRQAITEGVNQCP